MCPWKDEIRKKLCKVFENDAEGIARVLYYLHQEDNVYKDDGRIPPVWRTLKSALHSDAVFKEYAKRLIEDTKQAEYDEGFRETMSVVYSELMKPSEKSTPSGIHQSFDLARVKDLDVAKVSAFLGLARAWSVIPAASRTGILQLIPNIIANQPLVGRMVGLVNRVGGNVVMVALAGVYLSYKALNSIYQWWKGEITGKRCCKTILDSFCTISAGIGGGIGGAALGSFLGPVGSVVGGIAGAVISSEAMNYLSDRLTQRLFGIPKDQALENAYNFLGVKMNASNYEINTAFRKLCLKYHPDKGGSNQDFHLVQTHMGVIKAARGYVH